MTRVHTRRGPLVSAYGVLLDVRSLRGPAAGGAKMTA